MSNTKIIFEQLSLIHFPLLYYYLLRQKEVKFFDNENRAKRKKWVKRLVRERRISAIPSMGYLHNECYGTALDNVEYFYKYFAGKSILAQEMVKLYQDEAIGLAYKKEITRDLSEFYYINSYLHNEESQLEDNERILLIQYRYKKCLGLAERVGAFYHSHQRIDFALGSGIYHNISAICRKIKSTLFQIGVLGFYFARVLFGGGNGKTDKYKYAVAVISPDSQLRFKNRSIDFLINGNEINKDNTVFLLLNPAITRDHWDEIKSKNLKMLDCSKRFISSPGFDSGEKLRILRRVLPYSIKVLFLGLLDYKPILDVNNVLLPLFFKWSSILRKVSFKYFITLNDTGIDHIGRNILLNKSGVKTWYYAHSASLGYLRILPRHWLWSFLYYDSYVAWNAQMIEYFKLHPQRINDYLTIGCLWSQSVVDVLEGRSKSSLKEEIFTDFQPDSYKILTFFDSSYVPDSLSPLEDGVAFYRCILRLLKEFPNILVIVKEKKAPEEVLQVYQYFGDTGDIINEQYKPVLEELRRHPRCHLTGYKGDPAGIIAISDLSITFDLSSSTVEALCAGKRAIFFDPCNRWRGCYYDKIPDLIAHDYEELTKLINKLLYETNEEEYRDFLNTSVKGEFDPYLDGKAVTRFQKLLAD